MSVHSEAAFEATIEAHLLAHDWHRGDPSAYRRGLGLDTGELFTFIGATQAAKWAKVVAQYADVDTAQKQFAQWVASELSTRGVIDVLRHGVKNKGQLIKIAQFKPAHGITASLQQAYAANRLTVTRQVHHSESHPHDSLDLLLSLNGVPVATAELKNPLTGQGVEQAKKQYREQRYPTDLIFAKRTVVHFAVDPDLVFLSTTVGPQAYFLPFNQGSNGPGRHGGQGNPSSTTGYRTRYLWEQVWQRDAWLDLLHRFVHVEHEPGTSKKAAKTTTIFPRYHQWDVVKKLDAHASTHGPGRAYLLQHSAGSGKSNSIAWLAHRLSTLHTATDASSLQGAAKNLGPDTKVFHKVVVVTDRVVLDRQLQETIAQFDHTPGVVERIDKNSQQLADALTGSTAQIVITTLQKFPVVKKAVGAVGGGKRYAVIVDEAHSSQSGEAAKGLKSVLGTGPDALAAAEAADAAEEQASDPEDALSADVGDLLLASARDRGRQANLSFFAFTATPKQKTLELFGEKIPDPTRDSGFRHEAFHLYSMRQAVDEGFILDVLANYVTYTTYYRLANGAQTVEGSAGSDPEVDKRKASQKLARFVSLHPSNLAQKAEIIVEHFRTVTAGKIGGRAKAMVVTRSRLHAVRYHQAIEKYIAGKGYQDVKALVAFSGKVEDPDVPGEEWTEPRLNRDRAGNPIPETETAARFKGEDPFDESDYQVLIVAEKYQTGFDEPLLHTMYVDKKLDGVKAVQTLSRLNRTTPGKEGTFVLDFANDAEDLKEAFRPFFETTWTEPTDPNLLYTLQQRIESHAIVHPADVSTFVAALLKGELSGNEVLYATTDAALERYRAMPEPADQEDFRTALRDFVRMYAFLGQVITWHEVDLEELFYYGSALLTRLPKLEGEDGDVDVSDAATLTHLRTQITGEHDVSLAAGDGEDGLPPATGGGAGAQNDPEKVRLSEIIAALNSKFGLDLGEADTLLVEQYVVQSTLDPEMRAVAMENSEENFGYRFDKRVDDFVIDRQNANEALFTKYFDDPAFQTVLVEFMRKEAYRRIRGGEAA
ncbi:type I restriction endonuclease subunit R [Kineococcus sp. TBRC 1896]|uniref:Type I restriction endonuclease subunit R n=1 Tax=Kineococcus mangrovi TaxID=1660183 RepID=A0ABV4I1Z1_9ACTN